MLNASSGRSWRLHHSGWVRCRLHPQPHLPRSVYRSDGTQRGCTRVFNPTLVSYADLLRVFWESHDPTQGMRQGNDWGTQYRSGIYTYSDAQAEAAQVSRDEYDHRLKAAGYSGITTEIQAATEFYYAEEYHQQYLDKTRRVIAVLAAPAWPAVLARASRPKPVTANAMSMVGETTPTQ